MSKDDVGHEVCAWPLDEKRYLFGTDLLAARSADMAMRADPGLHAIFHRVRVGRNHDRAACEILGELGNEFCVFFKRAGDFAVNREINE
jgi:hypothetical protein